MCVLEGEGGGGVAELKVTTANACGNEETWLTCPRKESVFFLQKWLAGDLERPWVKC